MNFQQLEQSIKQKMQDVVAFVEADVPEIIGMEATRHFKESFDKEQFNDDAPNPWQDVKRRDPNSPWYGFDATAPKHFSQKRTQDKILKDTGELANAFSYRKEPGKVTIINDKPYAAVHNFGGQAKVFGKTPFTMPQRKFMDYSQPLKMRIDEKISKELNNILKK